MLSDQAARDLPILHRRYPTLSQAPIAYAIEQGSEVVGLGGNAATSLQMPVFVPVPVRR